MYDCVKVKPLPNVVLDENFERELDAESEGELDQHEEVRQIFRGDAS